MEDLLGKQDGPELLYRYLLLAELNDDPEPLAASALMKTLSDMGTTEQAVGELPSGARFDRDYTSIIEGIHVLQALLEKSSEAQAAA